ncbi:MAG: helix-turn-helix transcriptional regulator [Gammaproteobacteria bacterium]|nr:helix-turn-helix transcriptional regulator [Gammaproteobacteria bacterium]
MDFGERTARLRKEKGLSRDELGKLIGTSGPIMGRYERGDMKPSIEIATKIATALGVSLDYLVGNTDLMLDNSVLKRIQDIQQLKADDQSHVFAMLDAFLLKSNIKDKLAS